MTIDEEKLNLIRCLYNENSYTKLVIAHMTGVSYSKVRSYIAEQFSMGNYLNLFFINFIINLN